MEIEIIERKENKLLHREEVTFRITHTEAATPSRETVAAKLAAIVNSDKDKTILKKIEGEFGLNTSLGLANIYESTEYTDIEPEHILKRNSLIGEDE